MYALSLALLICMIFKPKKALLALILLNLMGNLKISHISFNGLAASFLGDFSVLTSFFMLLLLLKYFKISSYNPLNFKNCFFIFILNSLVFAGVLSGHIYTLNLGLAYALLCVLAYFYQRWLGFACLLGFVLSLKNPVPFYAFSCFFDWLVSFWALCYFAFLRLKT